MKTCSQASLVLLCLAAAVPSLAQEDRPREPQFYRIDFVVKELEGGKAVNSRAYSSMVPQNDRGSIRTGNRVPIPSGSGGGYQFFDVGINLDFNVQRELPDRLVLNLTVDISSIIAPSEAPPPPVTRQNKWTSVVVVPLRKPTLVFSSDDPGSKRQMQVELTATPVK
jgi:hypothetical protein